MLGVMQISTYADRANRFAKLLLSGIPYDELAYGAMG